MYIDAANTETRATQTTDEDVGESLMFNVIFMLFAMVSAALCGYSK